MGSTLKARPPYANHSSAGTTTWTISSQKTLFCRATNCFARIIVFSLVDDPAQLVAVFTLSNDSIKKIPGSRKKKVEKNIPREKIYSSYPAVMIGRLGISLDFQSKHLGSDILSFIKAWFVDPLNKTGCRFLLVDSYNRERNLKFYQNNEFKFLFSTEEQEREFRGLGPEKPLNSRLMYFDLIELKKKQTGKAE